MMTLLFWSVFGCTSFSLPFADPRLVVYVMYFQNNSTDPEFDVLGKGIADMLITDLTRVDGLTVVERARVQDLVDELNLQQTDYFDPATVGRVGKAVGATHAVTGALTADEHTLQIDIRLLHTELARVEMTDKVVGKKAEFFALEQQLADKFTTSLGKALAPAPVPSGAQDVSLFLEYARGIDSLDRGDWARAEQILAGVLTRSPDFQLAKRRHDEALARLAAARERREALLTEEQRTLMTNAEAILAGDVTQVSTGRIQQWFGYRQLRGQIYLDAANRMVVSGFGLKKSVPSDKQEGFREAMTSYFENSLAWTAEMRAWRAMGRSLPTMMDLSDDDQERAQRLGVDWLAFGRAPDEVAQTLVKQVCLGELPAAFHGSAPTLVSLDPELVPRLLEEVERSLADVHLFEPRFHERQAMRLLIPYGKCLVTLGREREAVEKWQAGLEKYPTSAHYAEVEALVRQHL